MITYDVKIEDGNLILVYKFDTEEEYNTVRKVFDDMKKTFEETAELAIEGLKGIKNQQDRRQK